MAYHTDTIQRKPPTGKLHHCRQLLGMSGYHEVVNLGKNLGIPLMGEAPRFADYQYLRLS